jgi:hypothetical protein
MEEGDEGSSSSIAAHRGPGAAAVRSYALPAGLPHVGSSRSTETGHRPPSPRSLLASAKAGSMFVTNTTAGSMSAPAASSAHSSLDYQQQHNADDDAHDDSDDEARCGRMPACVRQGSLERAAQKHDSGNSTGSGSMHPHAAAAAVAALAVVANHESPAGSGSSTPRRRRESLQRCVAHMAQNSISLYIRRTHAAGAAFCMLIVAMHQASTSNTPDTLAVAACVSRGQCVPLPGAQPCCLRSTLMLVVTLCSAATRHAHDALLSCHRRLTPGVMLINTSPSTPTAADAAQDPASSTAQPSPACSSQASPGSISPARHAHQQPHQQQRACRSPPHSPACQADSSSDDILTLDPDELAEDSRCSNHSTASRSPAGTAALALASSGSLSGGARPGTAPSYRPGTPLKSCMRGGGSSNSSSSSLPYVGSASTPASSAEAAAAAAAALASLGLQPRHGAPSPLSGKAAAGQQGLPDKHGNGGGRDWVEADWDESSEDDEGPGPSHSAQQVRSSGAGVTLAASSKAAPGVCNAGAALVGVRGVKADNNWLDDDFDS